MLCLGCLEDAFEQCLIPLTVRLLDPTEMFCSKPSILPCLEAVPRNTLIGLQRSTDINRPHPVLAPSQFCPSMLNLSLNH
ncbi:hypothetical protein M404DRAFT_627766 [Pisolithus tinctorius Marx 270]|uniref:Uncharacterized protein n=1 Tax=Pisolithus tinctorius Marx 270 TaxID=870435 RepID=A0A0C3P6S8_PISTI|nr:hypothetical protein M404DRAFT_627766 [Pisolithus tinctorius Marx 270]